MPRAKTSLSADGSKYTATYRDLDRQRRSINDKNDCAVKAVCLATGAPYIDVHTLMAKLGRKAQRGTRWHITTKALQHFGYELVERCLLTNFIQRYPSPHCHVLRSVTTHHPERFRKVWADGRTYMLDCRSHVLTVINGVNHDWTKGRANRVRRVFEVVKKETK